MELTPAEVRTFAFDGEPYAVLPVPGGHINQSYRVRCSSGAAEHDYLVQRLNPRVFPDGTGLMANISAVTNHLKATPPSRRARLPLQHELVLVPTHAGAPWCTAPDGAIWRAFPYLPGTAVHACDISPAAAFAAGLAFGTFLELLRDYAGPPLSCTITHFHDIAWYFERLEDAARADAAGRGSRVAEEIAACRQHRTLITELPIVGSEGIPVRVTHNDAKAANVLLDAHDAPLAVVDLDTVMPGSALSDVGDLLRSLASPTAEDAHDLTAVRAEPVLVLAALEGWYLGAGSALSARERECAVLAGCAITLEQAVRFLTDYLQGDSYYGASDPEQNLRRARTQLRLLQSLLAQRRELERAARHLPTEVDQ
ncbi:MAG TPA: aminoglycoside phosphotransferase family protein [Gemmatimonadales bacterium]|nr:aminoglycoside phosphotransferase family protein [Gemmatimonadales bacterium]